MLHSMTGAEQGNVSLPSAALPACQQWQYSTAAIPTCRLLLLNSCHCLFLNRSRLWLPAPPAATRRWLGRLPSLRLCLCSSCGWLLGCLLLLNGGKGLASPLAGPGLLLGLQADVGAASERQKQTASAVAVSGRPGGGFKPPGNACKPHK